MSSTLLSQTLEPSPSIPRAPSDNAISVVDYGPCMREPLHSRNRNTFFALVVLVGWKLWDWCSRDLSTSHAFGEHTNGSHEKKSLARLSRVTFFLSYFPTSRRGG